MAEDARTPARADPVPTVLAAGTRFEGLLAFRGAARIDGEMSGDVVAEGRLVIGPKGLVRARIEVDELIVGGELEGDVDARTRVELQSSGSVTGTLRSPKVAIAEGGLLRGRCVTPRDQASAEAAQAPEPPTSEPASA